MSRYLRRQLPHRSWVLLTVLFLLLKEWEVISPVQWRKNSKPCLPKDLPRSRSISQHWLQFPCSYRVSADLKTVSCLLHNQWHLSQTKFRTSNNLLTVSQLVSQPWRLVRPLALAAPTWQDHGTYLDIVTAPQPLGPLGPMALGHLMTIGIQDADLIHSQAPKMNNHEVPFYSGSLANNTTKGLQSGSIIFGKNPTCQHTTNLSEIIAKQVLCRSGLYLKHDPNVKTLLLDFKMMVSPMQLTVPSVAPIQLSL